MKIFRFRETSESPIRVGFLIDDSTLRDFSDGAAVTLQEILEHGAPAGHAAHLAGRATGRTYPLGTISVCAPIEQQEVWAAGVTYLRSKKARMEESDFSASAYDKVYEAARPEIFFKSIAEKVVGHGNQVGIRRDARWNVPEPELALVLNSRGQVVGHTIGNDMSSRDIEGENLLYLPQAKVYDRSCALGPCITLGTSESDVRNWKIEIEIHRGGAKIFGGDTTVANLKRSFDELAGYLFRSQKFPHGAVLLTGTGIVPNDTFTLAADDEVRIAISGVGQLHNRVVVV